MTETDSILVPSAPIIAYLELTYACNNRCPGCSLGNRIPPDEYPLTVDKWEVVLHKLAPHVAYLCLTGGEPALYPGLDQIIQLAHQLSIKYAFFTNGRWTHPARMLSTLKESPELIQLFFSLHGAKAESHDGFTHIAGSFKETCDNIALSAHSGLPVTIDTIITSRNFNHISEIVELSRQLGAESITFSRYVTAHENSFTPANSELNTALDAIEKQNRLGNIPVYTSVCVPQCFHQSSLFSPCLAGTVSLVVDPWGNVHPCVMVAQTGGNLLHDSLERVWRHKNIQNWREMLPESCGGCAALSKCRGGCRAEAKMREDGKDHLAGRPLTNWTANKPVQITLPGDFCPVADFTIRKELFGYILISGVQMIPVTSQAIPLIKACNGNITLREILGDYGQDGLNFIALLYKHGLIKTK